MGGITRVVYLALLFISIAPHRGEAQQVFGTAPFLERSYFAPVVIPLDGMEPYWPGGKDYPFILSATLAPQIFVWSDLRELNTANGWSFAASFSPRFDVRMVNGHSNRVPSPSFRPGGDFTFVRQSHPDFTIQGPDPGYSDVLEALDRLVLQLHVAHYSNGQEGKRESGADPDDEEFLTGGEYCSAKSLIDGHCLNDDDGDFDIPVMLRFRVGQEFFRDFKYAQAGANATIRKANLALPGAGFAGEPMQPTHVYAWYADVSWYLKDKTDERHHDMEYYYPTVTVGAGFAHEFWWTHPPSFVGRGIALRTAVDGWISVAPDTYDYEVPFGRVALSAELYVLRALQTQSVFPGVFVQFEYGMDDYNARFSETAARLLIGLSWGGLSGGPVYRESTCWSGFGYDSSKASCAGHVP